MKFVVLFSVSNEQYMDLVYCRYYQLANDSVKILTLNEIV